MSIEVLDLGINNLKSLTKSLESLIQTKIKVVNNSSDSSGGSLLIIPGVGNFGTAMQRLHERNLTEIISSFKNKGDSILGICLGMQLLGDSSEETDGVKGLGLISGEVRQLPRSHGHRVPNVGWMEVEMRNRQLKQFMNFAGKDFYFTHSYYLDPAEKDNILFTSNHGNLEFTSAVVYENIMGVQFHPEKSSKNGMKLLNEILVWARVKA